MRVDFEFRTEDGSLLRGSLHTSGEGPAPGIVMAHGFSGVKEQIEHYAARFADGGFAVLVFDHRGFGASDGMPRLEVDEDRQLRDWRDAITHFLKLPEVDPDRGVGIWGSSFAGGLAMILAASDARVGCVVAQIPNVSGRRNARQMFNVTQRERLAEAFAEDRSARLDGAAPRTVPVFSHDPDALCALLPTMSRNAIRRIEEATPSWKNEVTLRSVENMLAAEPAAVARYISPTPFMMIVGANDTCTFAEHQLETFELAREPKRLVIHPGGHFDTYSDQFHQTSTAALDWFTQHLAAAVPARAPTARAATGLSNAL